MKKKTKLELLEQLGEVLTSSSGSKYVILDTIVNQVTREYSEYSVTKNTLKKMGEVYSYTKNEKTIVLLKDNKFFFKAINSTFKPLSKHNVLCFPKLLELYVYNKKCEFLKNYSVSYLRYFNFLKSFTSFKEVKDFLGYTFISVDDFLKLDFGNVLFFAHLPATTAIKFVNNSEAKELYRDSKRMAGVNFVSPTSLTSLREYHDKLVLEQSYEYLALKDTSVKWFAHPIDKFLDVDEFVGDSSIKRITSDYDLYKEGLEMRHCIGSRGYHLNTKVFLSIVWENQKYSCQITDKNIDEIRGYRNSEAPEELVNHVKLLLK
jgi:hypothetical protein